MNSNLFLESSNWVFSLEFLKLNGSVLVEEFIDGKVATTNSDVDSVHVNSDGDSLGSELVDTFAFSHEEDLQLLSFREVVDVFCQLFVNGILLDRNINGNL